MLEMLEWASQSRAARAVRRAAAAPRTGSVASRRAASRSSRARSERRETRSTRSASRAAFGLYREAALLALAASSVEITEGVTLTEALAKLGFPPNSRSSFTVPSPTWRAPSTRDPSRNRPPLGRAQEAGGRRARSRRGPSPAARGADGAGRSSEARTGESPRDDRLRPGERPRVLHLGGLRREGVRVGVPPSRSRHLGPLARELGGPSVGDPVGIGYREATREQVLFPHRER